MKSFSVITLLLISTLVAKGQTQINIKDYETKWLEENLATYVKPQFAEVVRIFSFKNEKKETVVRDLYLDGHIRGEAPQLNGVAYGRYLGYYRSGNVRDSGFYINGERSGTWKTFYENGILNTEYEYLEGSLHGTGKAYDSLGGLFFEMRFAKGRRIGTAYWYHRGTSQVRFQQSFIDGKLQGEYKTFYKNGQLKRLEKYEKGERIKTAAKLFDENGNEIPYRPMSVDIHPTVDFVEYAFAQLRYPEKSLADKVQGKVTLYLDVDEANNLTKVTLLKGVNKECNEEAIRLVKSMSWISAITDDEAVASEIIVEVPFYTSEKLKRMFREEQADKWK